MGGAFVLSPRLTAEQVNTLESFSEWGHGRMKSWLVGNRCNWFVSSDGRFLDWEGDGDHMPWLHYLNLVFFRKWQVTLEGCVLCESEWEPSSDEKIIAKPCVREDGFRVTKFTAVKIAKKRKGKKSSKSGSSPSSALPTGNAANGLTPLPENTSVFGSLPPEMTAKIACFMDVEDVVRFRAVCKSANICCSSDKFMADWFKHGHGKPDRLLVTILQNDMNGESVVGWNVRKCKKTGVTISKLAPLGEFKPVSASGGLVCCINHGKCSIVVGNPLTKKWVELPPCPLAADLDWHLVSYPDEDGNGGMYFIVFDATCKLWFDSKLGIWNLGDGYYDYAVVGSNVLAVGDGFYALVEYSCMADERALLKLNVDGDFSASKVVHKWDVVRGTPFATDPVVLLENDGEVVLKLKESFWKLDQSDWNWKLMPAAMFAPWTHLHYPSEHASSWSFWMLDLSITFTSPRMKENADKHKCASKFWIV